MSRMEKMRVRCQLALPSLCAIHSQRPGVLKSPRRLPAQSHAASAGNLAAVQMKKVILIGENESACVKRSQARSPVLSQPVAVPFQPLLEEQRAAIWMNRVT